jgi:hypothetical protein
MNEIQFQEDKEMIGAVGIEHRLPDFPYMERPAVYTKRERDGLSCMGNGPMKTPTRIALLIISMMVGIVACNHDGNNDSNDTSTADVATPTLSFEAIKTFHLTWTDVADATFYRLLENPDGISGFTQVGDDIPAGVQSVDHVVPLYARLNAQYILQSCNAVECRNSTAVSVSGTLAAAVGYFKASNTNAGDGFGSSVSLSADGNTLAVGASEESSAATGIGGDEGDNSAAAAGAVYVFSRIGNAWMQQAYVKASNTGAGDHFGNSVSLSADGNTLAVGAPYEDSAATGIEGNENDNSAEDAGAVYVFSRIGNAWMQQAYVKASNTDPRDYFGNSVSLSADGDTLVVGAPYEESAATGIGGDESDNTSWGAGAVYVFNRSGSTWAQGAYLKALNPNEIPDHVSYMIRPSEGLLPTIQFGATVSLSADGNTLAVGTPYDHSRYVEFFRDDNGTFWWKPVFRKGSVYVFTRRENTWAQEAYLEASNWDSDDQFGSSVSLSAEGNTLAVGASEESSAATGIGGDESDNTSFGAGAAYVFSRSGDAWMQQAYVKAGNTGPGDFFGGSISVWRGIYKAEDNWVSVSVSADGNTLAVGAGSEASTTTGIGGDESDNSAAGAGAVYLY